MKKAKVIQITNPENEVICIIKGADLGAVLRPSANIVTLGTYMTSAKARNGKQVIEYEVEYTVITD